MPLYFPRNKAEEQYAVLFLPQDIGKSPNLTSSGLIVICRKVFSNGIDKHYSM